MPSAPSRSNLARPGRSRGHGRARFAGLALAASMVWLGTPCVGQAQALFFTDLESGSNRGGEGDNGAFVTAYGRGFGSSQGSSSVTVGGGEAVSYPIWSDTRITFQLGPAARTGDVVVTTARGASNPLPFTVRSGSIFFVASRGSDTNGGSYARPWATVVHAKNTMTPGDVTYLMDGVSQTSEENAGAAVAIERGGEPGRPLALVAYPGARTTIGSTALEYGVRALTNEGTVVGDWVLAGLVLRGQVSAAEIGGFGSERWRVVGNDISCPVGDGQTGCFAAALASHVAFLGNEVHNVGTQAPAQPSKQYHAVYFTTDTNHVEAGWNHIHDNATCRAIQLHSSPLCIPDCGPADTTGFNQHSISIHDNLIHGDVCDGINLATVDPSRGSVRVFNNLIFDVGRGPSPPDGDANYAGIYVAGSTNNGPDGSGVVEVFNNTLYDCGARAFQPNSVGDEGAFARGPGSPGLIMELVNNLVLALPGEHYLSPSSATTLIRGSNNLWRGAGQAPSNLSLNVEADPLLVDPASLDFHLRPGSPAVDAGTDVELEHDHDGVSRPQGSGYDLGAFELVAPAQGIRRGARRIGGG
ncbi:MAG: hypothetical protein C3F15_15890 [Holophagae bacterium]|nr:MAG: hypothetical protein C3F15_15890 [Holophagae bacterium]